ncbi:MAG: beta strand repeat-containing protein [Akkermansiaceae bacterium]
MSFTGNITANTSSTRPGRILLDGSNTGINIISSNITSPSYGQDVSLLVKNGSGTWILSGNNNFSGTGMTSATSSSGIQINAGVLSVRHNNALGSSATAGSLQVRINSGILELANQITLDNGINLNMNNGATIRSTGSNTINSRVTVTTTQASSVNLSTANITDVLTIGNATNDLTGGATDTSIQVTGAGTIVLPHSNNYKGVWSLTSGTLQLGNNTSLGLATSASVVFGASSDAILKLNGFSPTITGLSTNTTLGTPSIVNGNSGTSTLTVNNATSQTFAGALSDGSAGILAFTKGGSGTLALTGNLDYTGATTITNGTLIINSQLASPSIAVNSGSTLSGNGTIMGSVTISSTSRLAPGNGVGTLTMGSLTLASGAIFDCEFKADATANDLAVVTSTDGLMLNGGGFHLYEEGSTTQFRTPGTYTLISYNGTTTVSASNLTVLNPDATKNYSFSSDANNINLTITPSVISQWGLSTGGDWSNAGNWTGAGLPNASGYTALLGSSLTESGTITLNGDKTIATLSFDNANSYTITAATSETLYFDNTVNSGQSQIIGTTGNHQLLNSVALNSNTVISVSRAEDTITLNGVISGAGSISKSGPGSIHLGAINTYQGGTTISGGTVSFASGGINISAPITISNSRLKWASGNTDDISLAPLLEIVAGDAQLDTNGNDVAFSSSFGGGGAGNIIKSGEGKLTLVAGNNFGGASNISGGILSISADSALGSVPAAFNPQSITIGGATLQISGNIGINTNRGITLSSSNSNIDITSNSTVTYSGIISGNGALNLTGTGTFNVGGTNTFSGGTRIAAGSTLNLSGTGTAGIGPVNLQGGQVNLNRNTFSIGNIVVEEGNNGTIDGINDRVGLGGLSGSGSLTLISRYGGSNVGGGAFGFRLVAGNGPFTGTLNLKSGIGAISSFAAYFNGGGFDGNLSNALVNITDNARLAGVNNSFGNTMNVGALSGDTTAILAGADYAGSQTYNIGAKNLDTTFQGLITNGSGGNAHIIKSGSGSLTLTGANTYAGTTTVNSGTLAITNSSALGSDTVGTTINGGDVNGQVAITGDLTLTEALTIGGRQGLNLDAPHIVNRSGNNQLSASAITPATGGSNYNFQSDQGNLKVLSHFTPSGAVTGARFLQLLGDGNGEWSGSIGNGTATLSLRKAGAGTWILSGMNHYTGDTTVDAGTLSFTSTSETKFNPTSNGTSNQIAGNGAVTLDGKFDINLASANLTNGNSWLLVDTANLTETYGANFSVNGFTKTGNDWMKVDGAATWTFSETTGLLSLSLITDPFIPWVANYFPGETNAAIIGKGADPDNDGRNNLAEFAFNSNPSSATSVDKVVGKVLELNGNRIWTLTLPVRTGATFSDDANTHEEVSGLIDGIIYRIQGSADLNAWTLDVSEIEAVQTGLPILETGWSYRTFRAPGTVATEPSDFLRVKVTE